MASGAPDRAAVRRLLVRYRAGRALEDAHAAAVGLGLRPPTPGQLRMRPRRGGISQRELGALLGGYSERQVHNWETGRSVPPLDVVRRLPVVLGMEPRAARWLLEVLHPQQARREAPAGVPEVSPIWAGLVHHIPAPAYLVTDITWQVVVANDEYHQLFPWAAPWSQEPEPSLLRAVMLRPEARQTLVRWREDWAGPAVDTIWSTLQVHHGHQELEQLVSEVLAVPEARELWEEREAVREPRLHHGEEERQVRHPEHGLMDVVMMTMTPGSLEGHRLLVMAPPTWTDPPPSLAP